MAFLRRLEFGVWVWGLGSKGPSARHLGFGFGGPPNFFTKSSAPVTSSKGSGVMYKAYKGVLWPAAEATQ